MGKSTLIRVKRCHELGNVILLLSALDYLYDQGTVVIKLKQLTQNILPLTEQR